MLVFMSKFCEIFYVGQRGIALQLTKSCVENMHILERLHIDIPISHNYFINSYLGEMSHVSFQNLKQKIIVRQHH